MKTVYKYRIGDGKTFVEMPYGAEVLHVAEQGRDICVWALVDTDNGGDTVAFAIFGTGREIPDGMILDHVGTLLSGPLVWHVFRVTP